MFAHLGPSSASKSLPTKRLLKRPLAQRALTIREPSTRCTTSKPMSPTLYSVIRAAAGIQMFGPKRPDSRHRGNDTCNELLASITAQFSSTQPIIRTFLYAAAPVAYSRMKPQSDKIQLEETADDRHQLPRFRSVRGARHEYPRSE